MTAAPAGPRREDVAEMLKQHRTLTFSGDGMGGAVCLCDHQWRTLADHRDHIADAVMALYTPLVEVVGRVEALAAELQSWRGDVINEGPGEIGDMVRAALGGET